jgi:hypothetical protein
MPSEPRENTFLALDSHGFHRVAYYEWGDPREHHAVVCVHGLTRNGRDFDMLAMQFARYCCVVSMDVVGRGASEWLNTQRGLWLPALSRRCGDPDRARVADG